MPAAELAKVSDPEIKQRAAAVQAAHDEQKVEKAAPVAAKKGGRCPSGATEMTLSQKEIVTRKTKCPGCGTSIAIKDEHFNDAFTGMTIPKHNLPKIETPAVVVAQVAPVQHVAPVAQTAPVQQETTQKIMRDEISQQELATRTVAPKAIHLFVDVVLERGARPTPLEDYYLPKVREMEEQHGAADIRCAPQDSPLGYGKWKGALASYVRAVPPAPGVYFARSANEIEAVVIEALAPMCDTVARGVR